MSDMTPETIEVATSRIACDGSGGASGHPRVWLQIDPAKGSAVCGYCGRIFVLKQDVQAEH